MVRTAFRPAAAPSRSRNAHLQGAGCSHPRCSVAQRENHAKVASLSIRPRASTTVLAERRPRPDEVPLWSSMRGGAGSGCVPPERNAFGPKMLCGLYSTLFCSEAASAAYITSPRLPGSRRKATKATEKGTAAMLCPSEVDRRDPGSVTGPSSGHARRTHQTTHQSFRLLPSQH